MPAGRPKAEASEREIELLASVFCTNEEIAAKVGISRSTLERNFDAAIKKGREASKASLRVIQWKHAQKNPAMAIWLGKQYLGQKDRQEIEGNGILIRVARDNTTPETPASGPGDDTN